ncbi:hypothetical protein NUW58_g1650 [Xylaria curta]|uniref:Uncharacterized protein n=1 Tax=Xylaria curta TaxID=42375 RepID=A0ACC1PL15_9PEZI|nr:hypothetical protein NUW58_g1650 [Xylaria curta]
MQIRPPSYCSTANEQLPPYSDEGAIKAEDSDKDVIRNEAQDEGVIKDEDPDPDSVPTKSTATLGRRHEPTVTIHPLESKDGVIVKVQPPVQPLDPTLDHIPCDIVLVIDVSISMGDDAPAPANAGQEGESFGLSVLDLTKHAARTIVSALNQNDRLGIVTFGSTAKLIQELTPMTEAHREEANRKIDLMKPEGATNLWGGIHGGLGLFQSEGSNGRVPALLVLTDGQPNYLCPGQGYVNKIRSLPPLPAIVNTFGFGYDIKSGLLKSIAEACNGNYAFIPDAGMIGTVFVHAVAHLQSTFATQCTLHISAPEGVLLKPTTGLSIDQSQNEGTGSRTLKIQLHNLQYGQSRDIYLKNVDASGRPMPFQIQDQHKIMHAMLLYSPMHSKPDVVFTSQDMLETSALEPSAIAYHQSRSMICELLSSPFIVSGHEYVKVPLKAIDEWRQKLRDVIDTIPAAAHEDRYNVSLMEDLKGQISIALSDDENFGRWGTHYFLSLWNAHAKQLCNSFKDPGPLMYNDNPLFTRCRDGLDRAFDDIPPPQPSRRSRSPNRQTYQVRSMRQYNNQNAPCFAGSSMVMLATDHEVPICTLQQGMAVQTPLGSRHVRAVLKTEVRDLVMYRLGNMDVTAWHPVKIDKLEHENQDRGHWAFPVEISKQEITYSGSIYSVLLEPDKDADAHAILVGGVWGVTLGHGILSGCDARAHQFFGDHGAVSKELTSLGFDENGVYSGSGVRRDAETGLVASPVQPLPASLSGTTNTTNALPGFWCANKGHVGAYVPFIFVNDGVCDYDLCCDGTEEYGKVGGVKCANKCAEIGKEWRRIEKERQDNFERANKKRRTMVKESKELRRQVQARVAKMEVEIKDLEQKEAELRTKFEETEKAERGKVVKNEGTGKLGVLAGLAKARVLELREALTDVVDQRRQLQDKLSELEGILSAFKEEYNPNFNDEGVKKAVRSWEDYAAKKVEETEDEHSESDLEEIMKEDGESSGINWDEFQDAEVTDTDILYSFEAYLPGPLRNFFHGKINSLRVWLIENGMLADTVSKEGESQLVKAAREAHEAAAGNVRSKRTALDEEKRDLLKNYGTDDIFRVLNGKCTSVEAGEYEYELCWMTQTTQKSKKGGSRTNMGNFEKISFRESDEEERHDGKGLGRGKRMVLEYTNGQHCWNGPNRRTDVWLACAETEELWRVSEQEKCVYKMEVGTPAACETLAQPGHVKDEL